MRRIAEFFLYRYVNDSVLTPVRIGPYFQTTPRDAYYHCFGLLVNWRALWVGAHYSPAHKRLCVNLLPGVTLWWTRPGGQLP